MVFAFVAYRWIPSFTMTSFLFLALVAAYSSLNWPSPILILGLFGLGIYLMVFASQKQDVFSGISREFFFYALFGMGSVALLLFGYEFYIFDNRMRVPFIAQNLKGLFLVHPDTMYHANIANSLENFSVTGTGIDGLVKIDYHSGSHWLFYKLANFFMVPNLTFYNVYAQVLTIPVLIVAQTEYCMSFIKWVNGDKPLPTYFYPSSTTFLFAASYWFHSSSFPSGWNSQFVSDSFLLSLVLFFSLMTLLFRCKPTLLLLSFVFIINGFILVTKISTGVNSTLLLICFGLGLLFRHPKKWKSISTFMISVLLSLVYLMFTKKLGLQKEPGWFNLFDKYLKPDFIYYELIYNYGFLALFLLASATIAYKFFAGDLSWKNRHKLWFCIFAIGATFGNEIPIIYLNIPAGGGAYFSSISKMILTPIAIYLAFRFLLFRPILQKMTLTLLLVTFGFQMMSTRTQGQKKASARLKLLENCKEDCVVALNALEEIRKRPEKHVYVESESTYWALSQWCSAASLLGPAWTEKLFYRNFKDCSHIYHSFEYINTDVDRESTSPCELFNNQKGLILDQSNQVQMVNCR